MTSSSSNRPFENFVAPPEYHVFKREERRLLIDPVNHKWFTTDKIGETIIASLSERETFDEARRTLETKLDIQIPDADFLGYVDALFTNLTELGFLHIGQYTRNIPEYQPAAFPEVMYVHLTAACNLACSYCYNQEHRFNFLQDLKVENKNEGGSTRDRQSFRTKKFLDIISEAAENGLREVKLTGGEATLYKDFIVIARHAKSLGLAVNLMTNGALISDDNAAEIVDAVTAVSVSIDSATADGGHDQIRGEGSFQLAIDAVFALRKAGLKNLHLNGVVTPTTLNSLHDLLDFAYETLGASEVTIAGSVIEVNDPTKKWGSAEHVLTGEQYKQLHESEWDYYKDSLAGRPIDFRRQCGVGNGVVSVDPNGDMYPCQTLHEPEFKLGNAFRSGIANALANSPNLHRMSHATVDKIEECNVCPVRYICSSGCRSEAYTREGDLLARNKELCPTFFRNAENLLWESATS